MKEMKNNVKSFRLTTSAVEIIEEVKQSQNCSESDVIETALQILYKKLNKTNNKN